MLLRLMLMSTVLTSATVMGGVFQTSSAVAWQSDTLNPIAVCAPTPPNPDDESSEDGETVR